MPKFNPGDRVVCTNISGDKDAWAVGVISIVTHYDPTAPRWPVYAYEEDGDPDFPLMYDESELELVTDA